MAINVSQSFHRTSANAVDDTLTLTKAQMLAVNDNLMPSKYFTICQEDGAIYLYDKSATPSQTTGKFTKFEGGGGGGADLPTGGTTGQVLAKKSNADGDVEWKDDNDTIIQLDVLPEASESELGNIYQYIGETTNTLMNGFFYQCIYTGFEYSWVSKKVQLHRMISDNRNPVIDRDIANFVDFDLEDNDTYAQTDIKVHRLTPNELADIMSTLPGAHTQYPKYSTTEQVVGEWLDGKPLYQKTVIMTMPTLSTKYAIAPISDCDMLFVVWAFEYSSNSTMNMYPAYGNDAKLHGSVWTTDSHHADGGRIILQADDNTWAGVTVYVTVQYTKTTD